MLLLTLHWNALCKHILMLHSSVKRLVFLASKVLLHFGFLLSYWFSCIISNIMAFKGQVREVEYCLYLIGYILSRYGFNIFNGSTHYYFTKTIFVFCCRLLQRSKLLRMSQTTLLISFASVQILVTTMVLSLYQRA